MWNISWEYMYIDRERELLLKSMNERNECTRKCKEEVYLEIVLLQHLWKPSLSFLFHLLKDHLGGSWLTHLEGAKKGFILSQVMLQVAKQWNKLLPPLLQWPWKMIRKSRAPYKVACFMWGAAHEACLAQNNLQRRGITMYNRCFCATGKRRPPTICSCIVLRQHSCVVPVLQHFWTAFDNAKVNQTTFGLGGEIATFTYLLKELEDNLNMCLFDTKERGELKVFWRQN